MSNRVRTSHPGANPLTRRGLLRAGGIVLATGLTANACSFFATDPDEAGGPGGSSSAEKGTEAPHFADLVKQGKLPKVADRMPREPLVIEPVDRVGVYGGTWSSFVRGSDSTRIGLMVGYEPLVRWSHDWSTVVPNVAASWTVDESGREYVFQLREGMKWSDGEPFTADDLLFAYNDVLLNPELYPVTPYILLAEGKPAEMGRTPARWRGCSREDRRLQRQVHLLRSGGVLLAVPRHG